VLFSTLEHVASDTARDGVRPPAIVVVGDVVDVASGTWTGVHP
jgi:siroheme synthase